MTMTVEGGDDLPERARGADAAGGEAGVVAAAHHGRQGDEPMVTTVAPTMPVEAASSAPTSDTETAKPPRTLPIRGPSPQQFGGRMRDFSSFMPMKTREGWRSDLVVMVPKHALGERGPNRKGSKVRQEAERAEDDRQPVSTNTTGRPS
jgi:hypothetical protein